MAGTVKEEEEEIEIWSGVVLIIRVLVALIATVVAVQIVQVVEQQQWFQVVGCRL